MQNLIKPFLLFSLSLFFTSCFEISEEVNMNNDGSGDVLLTVNLSESKQNLASYMKMDQVQGMDVPKKAQIEEEIQNVKKALSGVKGITNVKTTSNFEDFIFTVKGDFDNVKTLNKAINAVAGELNRTPYPTIKKDNFDYGPNRFVRMFKYANDLKLNKEEYDKLNMSSRFVMETARIISVYRFDKPVKSFTNKKAQLSPSKKAVKLESTIAQIIKGETSIENEISF